VTHRRARDRAVTISPRLALDAGDGVGRSHESLDETRAVVHVARARRRFDFGPAVNAGQMKNPKAPAARREAKEDWDGK
jgi:hypothetical protein